MVTGGLLTTRDAETLVRKLSKLEQDLSYFKTASRYADFSFQTESRYVRVVNNTSADLEPFESAKFQMPHESFGAFANKSHSADYETFEIYDSDDTVGKTCIVQEGIAVGKSGMAIAHGLSFARIDFDLSSGHQDALFCDTNSTNSLLIPLINGTCEIIDQDATLNSDTFSVVRIGERRNCHAWGEADANVAPGAVMTVNLFDQDGLIPVSPSQITNVDTSRLHTKTPDISAGDVVRIEWDLMTKRWHAVNAVCP